MAKTLDNPTREKIEFVDLPEEMAEERPATLRIVLLVASACALVGAFFLLRRLRANAE